MNLLKIFRRSPEEKRRRQLLRQWRREKRRFNLALWLLRRLNRSRSLAAIAAAERGGRTVCLLAARRQSRRIRKKTPLENAVIALQKRWRHCRRRCRVSLHRLKTRLLRLLLVNLLCLALWLLWLLLPLLLPCLCRGLKSCSKSQPAC